MCPCATSPALPAAESSFVPHLSPAGHAHVPPAPWQSHLLAPHPSVDLHACGSCLQDMLISFLPHGEATYFHPPKLAYLIRTGGWPHLLSLQSDCLGRPGVGTVCCCHHNVPDEMWEPPVKGFCNHNCHILPPLLPPAAVLFGCGTLLALTAYRVLGSALSLLGGLASISCSLLLPTAFYALLSWRRLGVPAKLGLGALLAVGVALVVLITSSNICDLLERCRERHSHSGGSGNGDSLLPGGGPLAGLLPVHG